MMSDEQGKNMYADDILPATTKRFTVGIDEVGRGPIAGPVTVCATLWLSDDDGCEFFAGIRDSKKLSEKKRAEWSLRAEGVRGDLLEYSVHSVEASVIDTVGIIRGLSIASMATLSSLQGQYDISHIYSDYGLPIPGEYESTHIVRGDERCPLIALASIIAKVERDKKMCELSEKFDGYGFQRNKGYSTKEHREAILSLGTTPVHRKTFLGNIV